MTTAIIQNFEKMLADGKDNTLLRFSLGNEYLKAGDQGEAQQCNILAAGKHFLEVLDDGCGHGYSRLWLFPGLRIPA